MKIKHAALLAALATSACASELESGTSQEPLIVDDEGSLWDAVLGVGIVPMCWQSVQVGNAAEQARLRARVQAIVEEGWVAPTRLYVFWVDCPTSGPEMNVRTTIQLDTFFHGNTGSFGTRTATTADQRAGDPAGDLPGMRLWIRSDWETSSQSEATLRGLVLHEFGHILGFGHEMRHPDGFPQDNNCYDSEELGGGVAIGPPDQNSIMGAGDPSVGYCSDLNQITRLSPGDIAGARQIYGSAATHFGGPQRWSDVFCVTGEECRLGDVDGDGQDDIIAFEHRRFTARVWVGLSSGMIGSHHIPYYFAAPDLRLSSFCSVNQLCEVADVNADGRADLIAFTRGANPQAMVALSNGATFATPRVWSSFSCQAGEVCKLADVTGDGAADVVVFSQSGAANVWVQRALGAPIPGAPLYDRFGAPELWTTGLCSTGQTCDVADVDGDGLADAVAFTRGGNARVLIAPSTGGGFGAAQTILSSFCLDGQECRVADVDGDHHADAIAFTHDAAHRVLVARATRAGLGLTAPSEWSGSACQANETCMVGDVNGDGYGDAVIATRSPDDDIWVNPGNL